MAVPSVALSDRPTAPVLLRRVPCPVVMWTGPVPLCLPPPPTTYPPPSGPSQCPPTSGRVLWGSHEGTRGGGGLSCRVDRLRRGCGRWVVWGGGGRLGGRFGEGRLSTRSLPTETTFPGGGGLLLACFLLTTQRVPLALVAVAGA